MTRIGLLYPNNDPTSPRNWSGTPHGLSNGLKSAGAKVVPIPTSLPLWRRLPVAVRRRLPGLGYMTLHRRPEFVRARSRNIASAIAHAGRLDGIVAMGTDLYDLDLATQGCSTPIATYDDGTFALFLRYPDSDISRLNLPDTEVRSWVRLQEIACRRASVACVSTEWAKRSVVTDFGVAANRVLVVGMGHRPRSVPASGRDFSKPRFLFVGVEWKRKNGAGVLRAFAKVHERFPQATLDVVGNHPPLYDQPGVRGHGFLPRDNPDAQKLLDQLFADATAFVLPSLFDPSPIAYLEAASSGLPVIATTCGGAGELLGEAAICIDPYDDEALAGAMLKLADGELAKSMGAEALARSSSSSWHHVGQRILDGLMSVRG